MFRSNGEGFDDNAGRCLVMPHSEAGVMFAWLCCRRSLRVLSIVRAVAACERGRRNCNHAQGRNEKCSAKILFHDLDE
jgi:hypothetical protein